MSVLKPKANSNTRTLSVRLAGDLCEQVEQLRKDADAAGLVFDVPALVADTLAKAVRAARAELDAARAPAEPSGA